MKGFYFDLLAPPRHLQWLRASLLLLGGVAVAAAIAYEQAVLYPALSAQRALVQAEMARLGSSMPTTTRKPAELAQAWQQARAVATLLGLPWQRFFVALGESGKAGGLALISIEPDALKGHVVLVAEAKNLNTMLDFVGALQEHPDFSDVVLQSHTIDKTTPEKPVRFRVAATWRIAE